MVAVLLFSLHSFGSTRIHCIWPDPDPGKEIEVDPDPEPDPRRGLKWIRIRIRPNAVDPDPKRCFQQTEKILKKESNQDLEHENFFKNLT